MLGEVNKGHRENTQQKESLTKAEMKVLTMEGSGSDTGPGVPRGEGGEVPSGNLLRQQGGEGELHSFLLFKESCIWNETMY